MHRIDEKDRKILSEEVEQAYGVLLRTNGYVLMQTGENKIRIVTEEAFAVASSLKGVTNVGLYIVKRRKFFPTLTIEGCMFIEKMPGAHVVELSREQAVAWMRGDPVRIGPTNSKTILGVYRGHWLGSALVDVNGIAYPQVPKWRRIPESII
ncbi:MAG: hypothetical protein RMI43_00020 [Candidatus Caldarchaeum sp.]|nr:hypothetical protein [Candidatus Caldarchaeum sp.]MDW8062541.1 hypothetical protein [Candidatus Caldarchaeum sp.]MDW8435345.1 hypothetical protein [Candidatus Caldarchaeum sp.]